MASIQDNEDELVPFVVAEYIKNPIRAARIEAGVTQSELAQRINVTQEYIKEAEKRNLATHKVPYVPSFRIPKHLGSCSQLERP